jgi:hypothetical protein
MNGTNATSAIQWPTWAAGYNPTPSNLFQKAEGYPKYRWGVWCVRVCVCVCVCVRARVRVRVRVRVRALCGAQGDTRMP